MIRLKTLQELRKDANDDKDDKKKEKKIIEPFSILQSIRRSKRTDALINLEFEP